MVYLSEVRASNRQLTAATVPQVSVFVGATAGIGRAALSELIYTGFPVKVYIIGRDEAAFKPILSELQTSNPSATLIFLQGEVSLMAEAKRLTDTILSRETYIDLLFLSAGFLPFLGRQENTEGIELSTAVAYYSRQIFIRRLFPLLRAKAAKRDADRLSFRPRIVNVLAAGAETSDLFLDDLQLKEPGHFSVPSYAGHVATMTSVSLKRLAEQAENKDIVIIHHHPGLVSTDLFKKSWGDQWDETKQHGSVTAPADIERSTPAEAGERSLYVMTSAKYGGEGAPMEEGQEAGLTVNGTKDGSLLCVGYKLETLSLGDLLNSLVDSGAADTIWGHTNKLIGRHL
ncbi:uncharacterized oxidoreductase C736.13 [Aspergillus udagawae]|uniref:Uncharacterized oxidoreductase C736.13 n=1 Tax=Aspergillus udagawae TaxID=91492 RepID=A0A8H3RSM6_9EURO|nr:uncharacterized oxidoreductase C736.13 [Aspergillus udagawae]